MIASLVRPSVEVGDIFRAGGKDYAARHPVSAAQAAVLRRLAACRTAALGGHVDACAGCGYTRISYNSCRDRHCPKCQAAKRAAWLETRLERLLPVEYFHVVFTLPAALNALMLHHPRRLYDLLFQAASQTLLTLAADPKRLGAQISVTAILHTWGQNLSFHPHLHCVVTGGGLSPEGDRWIAGRRGYFLPVKVLGRLFRGKFLAGIRAAWAAGELTFGGSVADLADPRMAECRFAGGTTRTTTARRSCNWMPTNSSGDSCCTCCRRGSSAFVISACWQLAMSRPSYSDAGTC